MYTRKLLLIEKVTHFIKNKSGAGEIIADALIKGSAPAEFKHQGLRHIAQGFKQLLYISNRLSCYTLSLNLSSDIINITPSVFISSLVDSFPTCSLNWSFHTQQTQACINIPLLKVVCHELIKNAIDHTPAATELTITWLTTATHHQLNFSDTGPGFSETTLNTVLDEPIIKKTPEAHYIGLGLFMCYDMINKMKGNISVKNKKIKGTIISLEWPI